MHLHRVDRQQFLTGIGKKDIMTTAFKEVRSMRIASIIIGVLLVFTSVWCLAHPGATYLSLAFLLGAVMFLHGVTALFGYLMIRRLHKKGQGWLLADGIFTTMLSLVVLFNQIVADAVVPVFFGLWLLHSGVARIVSTLNERGIKEGFWLFFIGIISMVAGLYPLVDAILFDLSLMMMIGIIFLVQGVNMLYLGASSLTDAEE